MSVCCWFTSEVSCPSAAHSAGTKSASHPRPCHLHWDLSNPGTRYLLATVCRCRVLVNETEVNQRHCADTYIIEVLPLLCPLSIG